ncbi:MAG: hypothetical protein L0Z62_22210 [Gemmataceae bacterium]|nr:hypothetical protein [Gemmataceae bacterium]
MTMTTDYPAAHSMDTTWYAVDADGSVALFESGENGHVPDGMHLPAGVSEDPTVAKWLRTLRPPAPDENAAFEDEDWLRAGIYLYAYEYLGGWFAWPYFRYAAPECPLHIDEAPPRVRAVLRQFTFPALRFAQAENVQPCEVYPCLSWGELAAYLTGDGRTVRAVPGAEDDFWQQYNDFVEEFRIESPDLAADIRFEFPPRPPGLVEDD